jgi:hypothetical protein
MSGIKNANRLGYEHLLNQGYAIAQRCSATILNFRQKRTAGIDPTRSTPVRNLMPERLRDGIHRLGRDTAYTSHKGGPYYEDCNICTPWRQILWLAAFFVW